VVTLGGFAGRARFEGPFLATARESLLAYARARGWQRPIVVGHSLGGVLALQMALAAPDAIGGLVILDALPFLGGSGQPDATEATARAAMEPLRQMIRGQSQEAYAAFQRQSPFLRGMATRPEDVARITEWAAASDRVAVADAMFEVNTTDLRPRMKELHVPMLVLGSWYGLKAFTTREAVERTFRGQYAGASGWSFALADSARHFLMLDDPEWTWSHVDGFLAANARTASSNGGGR
jgi:pimeloyl-ACP methyl ester carboxylesterase